MCDLLEHIFNICSGAASNATWQQTTSTGRISNATKPMQAFVDRYHDQGPPRSSEAHRSSKVALRVQRPDSQVTHFPCIIKLSNGPSIISFYNKQIGDTFLSGQCCPEVKTWARCFEFCKCTSFHSFVLQGGSPCCVGQPNNSFWSGIRRSTRGLSCTCCCQESLVLEWVGLAFKLTHFAFKLASWTWLAELLQNSL